MRNTSGLTRKQRKAARAAKIAAQLKQYPPYYLPDQNTSAGGINYFSIRKNTYGIMPV